MKLQDYNPDFNNLITISQVLDKRGTKQTSLIRSLLTTWNMNITNYSKKILKEFIGILEKSNNLIIFENKIKTMKYLSYLLIILTLSSCKVQNMYVKKWCKDNDVVYPLSKDKTITIKNKNEVRRWAFKEAQLYWDRRFAYESDSLYHEWKRNNTCPDCPLNTGTYLRPYWTYNSYLMKYW